MTKLLFNSHLVRQSYIYILVRLILWLLNYVV
jgi:hypothetical protein